MNHLTAGDFRPSVADSSQRRSRMPQKTVLSVGQCGPDHAALAGFLNEHFDVEILTSDLLPDTLQVLGDRAVDLVLINRKLDADYSDGMNILTSIKDDPALRDIPVMIISNFDDAQQAAVAAGATRGFGKAELSDPAARETVAAVLTD